VAKKVDNEESQDALVYASVAVARVKLSLNDTDGARKDLDEAERILDTFDSVETIVHAAFYDANASYYQVYAHLASPVPQRNPEDTFLLVTCRLAQDGLCQLLSHGAAISGLH
jgi:hypothetical protein